MDTPAFYLGTPFDADQTAGIKNPVMLTHADGLQARKLATRKLAIGSSSDPETVATADHKLLELRVSSEAASGDNRIAYLRYTLDGAGGGEALRALTVVNENVGTAHGAHFGLAFDATAGGSECSGLGAAMRGTLQIPDVASWAPSGTLCAGMFEVYSDGSASDPAGLTELSVLRLCNSGDATGAADVDTDANILSVQGFTAASGVTKAVSSTSLAELPSGTVGLRVKIGTGTYYIPAVVSTEWN